MVNTNQSDSCQEEPCSIFGGSAYSRILLFSLKNDKNIQRISQWSSAAEWVIYRYVFFGGFVLLGCICLYPLLRKNNFKSKQRRKILYVDTLLIFITSMRALSLVISTSNTFFISHLLLFIWCLSTSCIVIALLVFLFILQSTTSLEPLSWKKRNTVGLVATIFIQILLIAFSEFTLYFNTVPWSAYFMCFCSMFEAICFLTLACGYLKNSERMIINRKPSIRLVREKVCLRLSVSSSTGENEMRNFRIMVRQLRCISLCLLIHSLTIIFASSRLFSILHKSPLWSISKMEIIIIEYILRITEILTLALLFSVGFFSPQHREAARQWIRRFSIRSQDSNHSSPVIESRSQILMEMKSSDSTGRAVIPNRGRSLTIDTAFSSETSYDVNLSSSESASPASRKPSFSFTDYGNQCKENGRKSSNFLTVPNLNGIPPDMFTACSSRSPSPRTRKSGLFMVAQGRHIIQY